MCCPWHARPVWNLVQGDFPLDGSCLALFPALFSWPELLEALNWQSSIEFVSSDKDVALAPTPVVGFEGQSLNSHSITTQYPNG